MSVAFPVPIWLDATAAGVGAVYGALSAHRRDFDFTGVMGLALVTGLGGGIIRDLLLLAGPPIALRSEVLIPVALLGAGFVLLVGDRLARVTGLLDVLGAAFIAVFTIVGAGRAVDQDLPMLSCVFVGVVAAVGGGVLRDVLVDEVPDVFRPGPYYGLASVVGASIFVVGLELQGHVVIWTTVGLVVTASLRLSAIRFGLKTRPTTGSGYRALGPSQARWVKKRVRRRRRGQPPTTPD